MGTPLLFVFDGWDGYQRSLARAVTPLSAEHLAFRASPEMRSVGELVRHIGDGRVDWFRRFGAPGSTELWEIVARAEAMETGSDLAHWLERTWEMVEATLRQWTVDDLAASYRHEYQGVTYSVSRQWTLWRIMAHDIHHGGQLSELLAMQGILPVELTLLGGHLTEPPRADSD